MQFNNIDEKQLKELLDKYGVDFWSSEFQGK